MMRLLALLLIIVGCLGTTACGKKPSNLQPVVAPAGRPAFPGHYPAVQPPPPLSPTP